MSRTAVRAAWNSPLHLTPAIVADGDRPSHDTMDGIPDRNTGGTRAGQVLSLIHI